MDKPRENNRTDGKGQKPAATPAGSPPPPPPAVAPPANASGGRWKIDPTMQPVQPLATNPTATAPQPTGAEKRRDEASTAKTRSATISQPPESAVAAPSSAPRRRWWIVGGVAGALAVAVGVAVALSRGGESTVEDATTRPIAAAEKTAATENTTAGNLAEQRPANPPKSRPDPQTFVESITQGDKYRSRALLANGADPNAKTAAGLTALGAAIDRDDVEMVRLLVGRGADPNTVVQGSLTPLLWAIQRSDASLAKFLLEKQAKANFGTARLGTPLALAARLGNAEMIRLLAEHEVEVDARNASGETALMIAARQGQDDACAALLNARASLSVVDARGATPLHFAVEGAQPAVVKRLLAKGARATAARRDGETPQLTALRLNQLPTYLLLEAATANRATTSASLPSDAVKYVAQLNPSAPARSAPAPGKMPTVKKLESPHALWLSPTSEPTGDSPTTAPLGRAVFALDGKFRYIQGFAALADPASRTATRPVVFRLVADGKEIWKSSGLTQPGEHRGFRAPLGTAKTLEMLVEAAGDESGAVALWVEPKLAN